MTNKNKFYRTYIVEFETSNGLKYYAGQHTSKYPDPVDDPYTGSGIVISRAKKKYGPRCVKYITWHDHGTKEEMDQAEITLISDCKQQHGAACVNLAGGGDGGNTREHMTGDQKAKSSAKMSVAQKEAQNRPETKAKRSAAVKESWTDPEVRAKMSAANARPEVKAKKSAAQKKAHRTSPVWHGELYTLLWQTWIDLGRPKCGKFQGYCRRAGITDLALNAIVRHFNERYTEDRAGRPYHERGR